MNVVRVSDTATLRVAEIANKNGMSIPEATDQLILTGYNRTRALQKWDRKKRRETKRSRAAHRRHI